MGEMKIFNLDDKKVLVLDKKLTTADKKIITLMLLDRVLERLGVTKTESLSTLHYTSQIEIKELSKILLVKEILKIAADEFGFGELKCVRALLREIVYGDHLEYHTDLGQGSITVILYLNQDWEENFHGETLFLGEDGTGLNISPKPNRILMFDARIKHRSSAPSRLYFKARRILVMNLARI